jgi:hypothetical protein
MRADAAQFRGHEAVHETQTPVQPRKKLVFDVVVDRERDFSAAWPNFSKIDDSHDGDVPTNGFERVLVWRVAVDRK